MKYRADIDGLRAVAVLPVVLFHAGFSSFAGGYVGVDVFFVISGYLITSIIAPEIDKNTFRFSTFYERRIRRLFPALFVVFAFCCVMSTWLFMPNHMKNFAQSLGAATGFVSNGLFYMEAGYFDAPAEFKPLLHTWSLSVEEQFYILFPPFLLLMYGRFREKTAACLTTIIVLSFALSVWGVWGAPEATFFLPMARAWELLLGVALALNMVPACPPRARSGLSALGLGLIALSVFGYSQQTRFPGLAALLPVLGTALVIHARAPDDTWPTRILSARPLVYVGLLSYSLYLWHWPLIVYARYYRLGELTLAHKWGLIALSLVLAALSLRYVEQPFRRRTWLARRGRLFATAAVSMGLMIVVAAAGQFSAGFPGRLAPETVRLADSASRQADPDRARCHGSLKRYIAPEDACVFGPTETPEVALWGDSHASALGAGLARYLNERGQSMIQLSYTGCPPALGMIRSDMNESHQCLRFNDEVLSYLTHSLTVNKVILIARWTVYLEGFPNDLGPAERHIKQQPLVVAAGGGDEDPLGRQRQYRAAITRTVTRLLQAGKEVVLFDPVPEQGHVVPTLLARLAMSGQEPASFTTPLEYYERRNRVVLDLFDELAEQQGIVVVKPSESLCDDRVCHVYSGGLVLYSDDNHLSRDGVARVIESAFDPTFERLADPPSRAALSRN